jgi:ABC-2 type transport system permease protein
MMLLLYGYALNWDVRNVRTVIVDHDQSTESRELVRSMTGSTYFQIVRTLSSDEPVERLFERNQARLAIVIPAGMADDLAAGRDATVQALLDGADANTATTILNYVQALVAEYDDRIRTRFALKTGREIPGIDVASRVWFNPDLRSTFFLLPGLIAFIMMLTAVVSTSLSIVREKERGTLDQLRITPMSTTELLIGKTIPYLIVSLLAMTIVLTAAHFLFGLTIEGSLVQLYLVSLLFLVGALSFGLLISTLVQRQQDAFQIAGLTSMLPTVLLSGFIFPIRSMPIPLQVLSHIVPARYYMRILRGIILKGAPATAYPWDLLALLIYATVMLSLASSRLSSRRA